MVLNAAQTSSGDTPVVSPPKPLLESPQAVSVFPIIGILNGITADSHKAAYTIGDLTVASITDISFTSKDSFPVV
jgi:hypothetical protein